MITVNLTNLKEPKRALTWIRETWGAPGDRWVLKGLSYIEFRKDRDASLFLLHWS